MIEPTQTTTWGDIIDEDDYAKVKILILEMFEAKLGDTVDLRAFGVYLFILSLHLLLETGELDGSYLHEFIDEFMSEDSIGKELVN